MLAIYPTLYPEEPLLSALVRFADAMGYPEPRGALNTMNGRRLVRLRAG